MKTVISRTNKGSKYISIVAVVLIIISIINYIYNFSSLYMGLSIMFFIFGVFFLISSLEKTSFYYDEIKISKPVYSINKLRNKTSKEYFYSDLECFDVIGDNLLVLSKDKHYEIYLNVPKQNLEELVQILRRAGVKYEKNFYYNRRYNLSNRYEIKR